MKTKILFLIAEIIFSSFKSQVGINTQKPEATLDVNVRIQKVNPLPASESVNRILALGDNNIIHQINADDILLNGAVTLL